MATFKPSIPALLGVSIGTHFTVASGADIVGNIKELLINNVNAAARTIDLHLVPVSGSATDGNAILKGVSIPGDTMIRFPLNTFLEGGATLQALASNASSIMLRSSWIEFGPTPVPIMKPQTPGLLQTSSNIYYAVTAGKVGNPKEILMANVTATDRTATLYYVPSGGSPGDSNTILDTVIIPANSLIRFPMNTALDEGDTIRALSSVNDAIAIRVSSIEY